jgi:hypothetical protein|tara:strand:+ start:443 stop:841 length:399 start_codon:yes stop_codon:yes gene_type:complete
MGKIFKIKWIFNLIMGYVCTMLSDQETESVIEALAKEADLVFEVVTSRPTFFHKRVPRLSIFFHGYIQWREDWADANCCIEYTDDAHLGYEVPSPIYLEVYRNILKPNLGRMKWMEPGFIFTDSEPKELRVR